MASPTKRSLDFLRRRGYIPAVVEKFNPYAKIRQDLFGILDIVAIKESEFGVLGVQTTSAPNLSNRQIKIESHPNTKIWKKAGNHIEIHGWSKKGARGKRKKWQVRNIIM